MEINVISLENRKGVKLGEVKKVHRGYARYLIRTKKALPHNRSEIEKLSKVRVSLEQQEAEKLAKAKHHAEQLKSLSIQLSHRATEEGKLYGSLGPKEIAQAITEAGVPVRKQDIYLAKGLLREIGEYDVLIRLHDEVRFTLTVQVVPASS